MAAPSMAPTVAQQYNASKKIQILHLQSEASSTYHEEQY